MNIRKIATATAMAATAAVIGFSAPAEAEVQKMAPQHGMTKYCATHPSDPGCHPQNNQHHHNDWRFNFWVGPGSWYYGPGPWYYDDGPWGYGPGYYYGQPSYYHGYHSVSKMSCDSAKQLLRGKSYRDIRTLDCAGRTYVFTATKNGHKYRITLNARTGGYSRSLVY